MSRPLKRGARKPRAKTTKGKTAGTRRTAKPTSGAGGRGKKPGISDSEVSLALVMDAITEGIYDWNIKSGGLELSERLKVILGLEESELTAGDWNALVHPDDFELYRSSLTQHFRGELPKLGCEYRIRRKSGDYIWVADQGRCIRDEDNQAVRLVGAIRDITARKNAESSLRESKARYALAMDSANEAVWDWDLEAGTFFVVPQFAERFGLTIDEQNMMKVEDWESRVHPDDVERFQSAIRAHLRGETEFYSCEFRALAAEDEYIWVHHRGLGQRDETGKVYRMAGSVADITARKEAERKLTKASREAESARQRLRDAIESLSEGIVLFDKDDCIVLFNSFFRQYFADAAGEKVARMIEPGVSFSDMLRAGHRAGMFPDLPADPSEFEGYIVERQRRRRLEEVRQAVETHLADGRWLQINEHKTADGGIASVYTDITDLKLSAAELQNKNARLLEEIEAHHRSKATIEYLVDEIKSDYNFEEIVGDSEALQAVLEQLQLVAKTDSTVLIQGETGTGKELFVRAIHNLSARKDRPLVKVNCAALPRDLIESELFGHEKGAFTGATQQRKGRFELADKGTIFLDEVGELSLEAQSKLLRVLQEREFERVGGAKTIPIDVRVIAATNRILKDEVDDGGFRSDLFFRLSVFPLTVPSLRDRRSDIPMLARHFLERYSRKLGKRFDELTPALIANLMDYAWPGNIRELENVIERAVILSPGPLLETAGPLASATIPRAAETSILAAGARTLEDIERAHIADVLESTGWTVEGDGGAARILGLNPSTLRGRMRKRGIKRPS